MRARVDLRRASLTAAASVAVACGAALPPAPLVVLLSPAPSASSAAPIAVAPPKPKELPPEGSDAACSDAAFAEALAALERAKDPDATREALATAIALRAANPELRVRRMELLLAAGETAAATAEAAVVAEVTDGANATAWLLLGRAAQAAGHSEDGRALLARSARIDPNGEAARLLGTASHCTAAAHAPEKDQTNSRLTFFAGWRGVFGEVEARRMVHDDGPDPTTEAQARARACVHNDSASIFARDACRGAGPWDLQTGRMHFHENHALVVPLAGQRFAVLHYYTGDGCRGGMDLNASLQSNVLVVNGADHGRLDESAGRCDDGMHDELMPPCIHREATSTTLFDASTGAVLLYLDDRTDTEHLTVAGTILRRKGPPGCDETIDLRRLPRGLAPRPTD